MAWRLPIRFTLEWNRIPIDNNLLVASEFSNGTDVTDHYVLQQMLVQRGGGTYSLTLSEFENEHDFFDRAQLIALTTSLM